VSSNRLIPLSRAARELIPELHEHQGAYGVLLFQYLKHRAVAKESRRVAVRTLFDAHATQALRHLNQVGSCIVRLGGVPLGSMIELANVAPLEPESEGAEALWAMLGHDARLELEHNTRLALTEETAEELAQPRIAQALAKMQAAGVARRERLEGALQGLGEQR
jgi:bacterioferritin (cytochrome b1)